MEESRKEMIYSGTDFWPDSVKQNLEKKNIGGMEFEYYKNVPGSLYESLCRTQEHFPDRICIVDDDGTSYTYTQFREITESFACMLHDKYRVTAGSHVGILLYNSLEYCVSLYAVNSLGAVVIPLSTKYKRVETESLMEKADLDGILFHRDFLKWFEESPAQRFQVCLDRKMLTEHPKLPAIPQRRAELQEASVMMFTSGTTSRSKAVVLKNYNIMHAIEVYRRIFEITEKDRTVLPIPAYHITGLAAVIGLFIRAGGCVWLHKFFDAERILKEMSDNHITFFHASPTALSLLLDRKKEHPEITELRLIGCGSSNMPKQKIRDLKEWMPNMEFRTIYGLTETSSPATVFPGDASDSPYIGSSGRPVPGLEFKICDEEGRTLPAGETGSILVRGTTVTTGYYHSEQKLQPGGWLDTGDLGYFYGDGYLFIADRKKDMINRGGEKICSFDVENTLCEVTGIRSAAVVGIPDEKYGEVPAAMIVPELGSTKTAEQIREDLKQKLAKFQIPVKILICPELPLTPNMKVDKRKVRAILQNCADYDK